MLDFRSISPQFVVPDVVRTAEYYSDKTGFDFLGYYAIVSRGESCISVRETPTRPSLMFLFAKAVWSHMFSFPAFTNYTKSLRRLAWNCRIPRPGVFMIALRSRLRIVMGTK